MPAELAGAAFDRRQPGQLCAHLGVDREVEVAGAEVDQVARLLPDRADDRGMGVAGRGDRDPGGEVEEEVAVDVLDGHARAPHRHDRVGPRQARRRPGLVVGHMSAGLRTRHLGDEIGHGPMAP